MSTSRTITDLIPTHALWRPHGTDVMAVRPWLLPGARHPRQWYEHASIGVVGYSEDPEEQAARVLLAVALFERFLAETGARPSSARPWCGHTVVGRRCPDRYRYGAECRPPRLDHPSLWLLPDGGRLLVHHPYHRPDQEEVAAFDEGWGTRTTALYRSQSFYFPGASVQVEVVAASSALWRCDSCGGPGPARRPATCYRCRFPSLAARG